eukprot:11204844-Lingulodinium_polyedra.AAC.1
MTARARALTGSLTDGGRGGQRSGPGAADRAEGPCNPGGLWSAAAEPGPARRVGPPSRGAV